MAVISADTKDALARELPHEAHCRASAARRTRVVRSSRAASSSRIATPSRGSSGRCWTSASRIRSRRALRRACSGFPTFAIALPERARDASAQTRAPMRSSRSRCARRFSRADRWRRARAATISSSWRAATRHGGAPAHGCCAAPARRPKRRGARGATVLVLQGFRRDRRAADANRRVRRGARTRGRARAARDEESHPSPRQHRGREPAALAPKPPRRSAASSNILQSAYGLPRLSPALREVAELRLSHPDESLAELGRRCNPPIAKPTVSGRLGALSRLADYLRGVQGSAKAAR